MFTIEYKGRIYTVTFEHHHYDSESWITFKQPPIARGRTDCIITSPSEEPDRKLAYEAVTHCSLSDSYNGITGEKIALARALQYLDGWLEHERDRDLRLAFWKGWFSTLKGKRSENMRKNFLAKLELSEAEAV